MNPDFGSPWAIAESGWHASHHQVFPKMIRNESSAHCPSGLGSEINCWPFCGNSSNEGTKLRDVFRSVKAQDSINLFAPRFETIGSQPATKPIFLHQGLSLLGVNQQLSQLVSFTPHSHLSGFMAKSPS